MKKILLVLSVFSFNFSVLAVELSPQEKLRKASYIVRALPPSLSDSIELSELTEDDYETFFNEKIEAYLDSPEFTAHFRDHLLALFRMDIVVPNGRDFNRAIKMYNSFNNVLHDILKSNEPWNQLLLRQEYRVTDTFSFLGGSDLLFLQFVYYKELEKQIEKLVKENLSGGVIFANGEVEKPTVTKISATTEEQKKVMAGVVTTQRFFKRYPTTKLNKNRARAAALFRVFLCDDMKPVVLTDDEEDKGLLKKSLMAKAHSGEVQQTLDAEEKHGSDPQCMSCHYKLDPMANVFRGSGLTLNPFASRGALVFQNSQGKKVTQGVEGYQQLGQAISAQKDYKACQVTHFWNWVIGEDIPLENERKEFLIKKFDEVGERPKDFIKLLIQLPEFAKYEPLKEEEVLFSHVKPVLQRCDSCHVEEVLAPILGQKYPYPETWEALNNQSLLDSIVGETQLHNYGANAKMPPKNANWVLSAGETDLLLAWLKHGAKDDKGNEYYKKGKYYDDIQATEYLEGFSDKLEPSFYPTFSRIVSKGSLFGSLKARFPKMSEYACNVDVNDKNSLGYPSPVSGIPIYNFFSPNYIFWWLKCLDRNQNSLSNYYQYEFDGLIKDIKALEGLTLNDDWNKLSIDQKKALFTVLERHVFGQDLLSESNEKELFEMAESILKEENFPHMREAMTKISLIMLSSENFLTY